MRSEIKRLLRESRENYFSSINGSLANNPKRFWSVMKQKSKTCSIPDCISMPAPSSSTDHVDPSSARPTATKPAEITEMFNTYFASVFTSEDLSDPSEESNADPHMTELILSEPEVEVTLKVAPYSFIILSRKISPSREMCAVLHATRAIDVYTHGGFFKLRETARDNKNIVKNIHARSFVILSACRAWNLKSGFFSTYVIPPKTNAFSRVFFGKIFYNFAHSNSIARSI